MKRNELLDYVTAGFDRIRRDQGMTQRATSLEKSLSALRDHFGLDTEAGRDRLHKSVADDEDQATMTRRRIGAARARSRSETHDEDLEAPATDEAPKYGFGEGEEFIPLAWRVGPARDMFGALVGEAAERAQRDARTAPRRPRSKSSN